MLNRSSDANMLATLLTKSRRINKLSLDMNSDKHIVCLGILIYQVQYSILRRDNNES